MLLTLPLKFLGQHLNIIKTIDKTVIRIFSLSFWIKCINIVMTIFNLT